MAAFAATHQKTQVDFNKTGRSVAPWLDNGGEGQESFMAGDNDDGPFIEDDEFGDENDISPFVRGAQLTSINDHGSKMSVTGKETVKDGGNLNNKIKG